MNEEIEKLVDTYLADGIISERERAVVLRKADDLGLDMDEVDLYLEARQQQAVRRQAKRDRSLRGETCPYCGGRVPDLADTCPDCGKVLTPKASEELEDIIENLENALVALKSGYNTLENKAIIEKYARRARLYYSNNPKIKPLLAEIQAETAKAEKSAKKLARKQWINQHPYLTAFFVILLVTILCWICKAVILGIAVLFFGVVGITAVYQAHQ